MYVLPGFLDFFKYLIFECFYAAKAIIQIFIKAVSLSLPKFHNVPDLEGLGCIWMGGFLIWFLGFCND